MDLHLRPATVGTIHLLMVSGEIDLATVPKFRNALIKLVGGHPGTMVAVDLDGVTACDDLGLGILLGAAARARETHGDLTIVCTDLRLLRRFTLTRLDKAITVVGRITEIEQSPPAE
jgi:anti-sigma B factor antagonist